MARRKSRKMTKRKAPKKRRSTAPRRTKTNVIKLVIEQAGVPKMLTVPAQFRRRM